MKRHDQTLDDARDAARAPHPGRVAAWLVALLTAAAVAAFVYFR